MKITVPAVLIAAGLALVAAGLGGSRLFLDGPRASALSAGADAARIEVRRPREDVVLEKSDGVWTVPRERGDLADAEGVELLLSGLRGLEFGPAADAGDSALAYGLGPADAAHVRVLDARSTVRFDGWFGRRAFARSAWFRASERDSVRLAAGLDSDLLWRTSQDWRERRALPGGCPQGVEVAGGGKGWTEAPPEAAKALCELRAARFADGALEAASGFERPFLKVRARGGGSYDVGERRGAERLVRVEGRAALLRVSASRVEEAAYLLRSLP